MGFGMDFAELWNWVQNYDESLETHAAELFTELWSSAEALTDFWEHASDVTDDDRDWISERTDDMWIALCIANMSSGTGSGQIAVDGFEISSGSLAHILTPSGQTAFEPEDVTYMDWTVYHWLVANYGDFQAEWNRLLLLTTNLKRGDP